MQVLDASIEIDAPAERVWSILADTARYGEWNPFVTAVAGELREGADLKVTIRAPGRKPVTFAARVARLQPGREVRWRGRWFLPGLFDGDHALTVEPLDDGRSRFRTREEVTGLLLPLLGNAMRQSQQGFEELCRAVKARAESETTPRRA
jgi:hypothetical protein